MRGIILAGGTGSRLGPLTQVVNKHMLPVGGLPMIFYPLSTLRTSGITDITIVSTPSGVGQLATLLESGAKHQCQIEYRVQDKPGGIADALKCCYRGSNDNESIMVILGDNIFSPLSWSPFVKEERKARCYIKPFENPKNLHAFGVPRFDTGKIIEIIEKPYDPPSAFAVVGLYVFGPGVWDALKTIKPSGRGELEITDVLNLYAAAGMLTYEIVRGFWGDAGTVERMEECSKAVKG